MIGPLKDKNAGYIIFKRQYALAGKTTGAGKSAPWVQILTLPH